MVGSPQHGQSVETDSPNGGSDMSAPFGFRSQTKGLTRYRHSLVGGSSHDRDMPDKQQNLKARHTATLESFVLRARRIEAHSLASDKHALHKLSTMEFKVEFRPQEGKSYIVQELPPEEQVESAAARVRPLILQSEPTHYSKVIKALGYFVRDDPELSTAVKAIRKDWERIQPNGTNHLGSYTQIQNAEGEQSALLSDTELAFAYIYGDVIHHDPARLASTKMFGVKERFKAATPIVAFMMVLSVATR